MEEVISDVRSVMPRQREKGFADISGLAGCVKKAKGIFADDKGQSAGCLGALRQLKRAVPSPWLRPGVRHVNHNATAKRCRTDLI